MKKILVFVLTVSYPFLVFAQLEKPTPESTGIKLALDIIEVDGSIKDLNKNVNKWIAKHFVSAKEVTTSSSDELITLSYIGTAPFVGGPIDWRHTLQVDIKENKVRIQIWLNESHGAGAFQYFYKKDGRERGNPYRKSLYGFFENAKSTSQSLNESLKTPAKDDW